MIRALIAKELREHGTTLVLLALFQAFAVAVSLSTAEVTGQGAFPLATYQGASLWLGVLFAPILTGRMVGREYRSQTQFFLATLPIARLVPVLVKAVLGAAILVAFLAATLAACSAAAPGSLASAQLGRLFGRSLGFLAPCYALAFAAAFFGRYRTALYAALVVAAGLLQASDRVDLLHFGPFALLGSRGGLETWPPGALRDSLLLTTAAFATALLLASLREGSVAAYLSHAMSRRERVFIGVLIFAVLMSFAAYEELHPRAPFDFVGSAEARGRQASVSIDRFELAEGDGESAEALARRLADELDAFASFLDLAWLPKLYIVDRPGLDRNRIEVAELGQAEGVLLHANLSDVRADWREVAREAMRLSLVETSAGRVLREDRAWVLDGVADYFSQRNVQADVPLRVRLERRAAYASAHALGEAALSGWFRVRDELGLPLARAAAWSRLEAFAAAYGAAPVREFLREALGVPGHANLFGLWDEYRRPTADLLREATGALGTQANAVWQGRLASWRDAHSVALASLPRLALELTGREISQQSWVADYRVSASPEGSKPESARLRMRYARLSWYDEPLAESTNATTLTGPFSRLAEGTLPGTFGRGERVASEAAFHSELLDCEISSGWSRVTLP